MNPARIVYVFVAFLEAHPDLRTIAYGGQRSDRSALGAEIVAGAGTIGLLKRYMAEVFGLMATPDLDRRLRIAAEAGDQFLRLAFTQVGDERKAIIDEMARLLSAYCFG